MFHGSNMFSFFFSKKMESLLDFNFNGEIQLIVGPMFSGKTTELARRVGRQMIAKKKCVAIKHVFDERYNREASISTYDDPMKLDCLVVSKLEDAFSDASDADVVAIDEGQFFPDLVEGCEKLANLGKIVIVAALDGDFHREHFNVVSMLYSKSEKVTKLTAVCMCCSKDDASFSRIIMRDCETNDIDREENYSCCRKCYHLSNDDFFFEKSCLF